MGIVKGIYWIARFAIVIISAVTLLFLLNNLTINVEAPEVRADVLAGRVMHNADFWVEPGVIDRSLFTQETADKDYFLLAEKRIPVSIVVHLYEDGITRDNIIYNKPAHALLDATRNTKSVEAYTQKFPATLKTDNTYEQVEIVLEVLYEI